jgi:hypothetical protein
LRRSSLEMSRVDEIGEQSVDRLHH